MPIPEWKILPLVDAKVGGSGNGSFTGYASTFGNVDSYGDTIAPGAYTNYLDQFVERGFIAWNHNWADMIGMVASAKQDKTGLQITADFHSTPDAQAARTVMAERLAAGKFMGLSIGYVPHQWARKDGPAGPDTIRVLQEVEVFETSLVAVPADSYAGVTGMKMHPMAQRPTQLWLPQERKSLTREAFDALDPEAKLSLYYELSELGAFDEGADLPDDVLLKAVWTTAYVNNLPDSAFAYVSPGGQKDGQGKTVPRSLRHFPHHDSSGSPDPAHVRNALARIPQANIPTSAKDMAKAHVDHHMAGMQMGKSDDLEQNEPDLSDDPTIEKYADQAERVLLDLSAFTERTRVLHELRTQRRAEPGKAGRVLSEANRRRLKELRDQIDALLTTTEPVTDPTPKASQPTDDLEAIYARFQTRQLVIGSMNK